MSVLLIRRLTRKRLFSVGHTTVGRALYAEAENTHLLRPGGGGLRRPFLPWLGDKEGGEGGRGESAEASHDSAEDGAQPKAGNNKGETIT